jgi:dGTPase
MPQNSELRTPNSELPLSDWPSLEAAWLAPYAMSQAASLGRRIAEPPHPFRTIFQRDRERIIHSTAFRRMMGKTQVLVGQINDHHRTRLTHTLEVSQIARTIARRLRFNEDLTEAIALSHDLGHPPFGHAGESILNASLKDDGGFDHNLYGLRRVDLLEERYPDFPGLNLSWEVREAFVQHAKNRRAPECAAYLQVGSPFLEAQLVDQVDSLAYDTHDTDDAVDIGLISLADLDGIELWRRVAGPVRQRSPRLSDDEFRAAVIRDLIAWQVADLIDATERNLSAQRIETVADVRAFPGTLVGFGPELDALKRDLEAFLMQRVYRHPQVMGMAKEGQEILRQLFELYLREPDRLPAAHRERTDLTSATSPGRMPREASLPRVIADYLAGMTDRYAREEFRRLFPSSSGL